MAPVERAGTGQAESAGRNRLILLQPDVPHKGERDPSDVAPRGQILPWAAAGVMAVIAILGYWKPWRARHIAAERPFLQFDLDLGSDEFTQPAISPDGMRVVFVSKGALAIRRFDQTRTTRLTGTDGGFLPFLSPNGQWVAFFAGRKLQKIAIDGGAPVTLCEAEGPGGGSWSDDSSIVATLNSNKGGVSRIPAAGGAPQPLTDSKSESGACIFGRKCYRAAKVFCSQP